MFSQLNCLIKIDILNNLLKLLTTKSINSRYKLVTDSRQVDESSIFCAYKGNTTDGRNFIAEAIANHARYILWESDAIYNNVNPPPPLINQTTNNHAVPNLAQYVGLLQSYLYNNPSNKINVIGITGTNGKTSIAHLIHQSFNLLNSKSALIGSNGAGINIEGLQDYKLTTPIAIDTQQLLKQFVKNDVENIAIEVSSHALLQGRVNGINFSTAIFTNLTRDHLDYHANMYEYYQAKKQLFFWHGLKNAVINLDDNYGLKLFNDLKINNPNLEIITYGLNRGDVRAVDIKSNLIQSTFTLCYKDMSFKVETNLIGVFNISNLLATIAVLLSYKFQLTDIINIIKNLKPILGRMEIIQKINTPAIIVDFAHNPDALQKVLLSAKDMLPDWRSKLYCIFGCGGSRDQEKRAMMGTIASKYADKVIVTSDNPRFEKPKQIALDIISKINKNNYKIILARKEAIAYCLSKAKPKDLVLILGKGHEQVQIIGNQKILYNDIDTVHKILEDLET